MASGLARQLGFCAQDDTTTVDINPAPVTRPSWCTDSEFVQALRDAQTRLWTSIRGAKDGFLLFFWLLRPTSDGPRGAQRCTPRSGRTRSTAQPTPSAWPISQAYRHPAQNRMPSSSGLMDSLGCWILMQALDDRVERRSLSSQDGPAARKCARRTLSHSQAW